MANATNQQVQQFVNERVRPFAEQFRALLIAAQDHKAAIDDVYAACAQGTPTWADNRTDGPPHLLAPSDVLSFNSFITAFIAFAGNQSVQTGEWAVQVKACVRAVG